MYDLRNIKFSGFQNHCWVFTYKPQPFHISLNFISNSNSAINFGQLFYISFLCRPKGSQLKLCLNIAELNFSYFAKSPHWLEMVGGKISQHANPYRKQVYILYTCCIHFLYIMCGMYKYCIHEKYIIKSYTFNV